MNNIPVIQFTDTHLHGDPDGSLRGVATLPALRAVLAHAAADIDAAELILVTGDIVQDDADGYRHFRDLFADFGKPVLCIPGNHDDVAAMRSQLRAAPFQTDGHIDLGEWRIALLDSTKMASAGGAVDAARLDVLARQCTSTDKHVLLCLHHQPVPMQSRWLDEVGLANADALLALAERNPNLRAMLWGHVHQAYDGRLGRIRLLATPSTCTQFLPHAENFAVDVRPPGYRRLRLCADGSIETEVVWLQGLRDSGGAWPSCSVA
ncbi:MAG: metallophosphoesterase [Steroidobacteraceae bacterium]